MASLVPSEVTGQQYVQTSRREHQTTDAEASLPPVCFPSRTGPETDEDRSIGVALRQISQAGLNKGHTWLAFAAFFHEARSLCNKGTNNPAAEKHVHPTLARRLTAIGVHLDDLLNDRQPSGAARRARNEALHQAENGSRLDWRSPIIHKASRAEPKKAKSGRQEPSRVICPSEGCDRDTNMRESLNSFEHFAIHSNIPDQCDDEMPNSEREGERLQDMPAPQTETVTIDTSTSFEPDPEIETASPTSNEVGWFALDNKPTEIRFESNMFLDAFALIRSETETRISARPICTNDTDDYLDTVQHHETETRICDQPPWNKDTGGYLDSICQGKTDSLNCDRLLRDSSSDVRYDPACEPRCEPGTSENPNLENRCNRN